MEVVNEVSATCVIRKFFPLEWSSYESVSIIPTKCQDAWIAEKKPIGRLEPSKVILRLRKPGSEADKNPEDLSCIMNTEIEEVVIRTELSHRGWGRKLYGFFPGGTVEEFVNGQFLTPTKAGDANTIRSLAQAFSRLHSIDLPLERTKMLSMKDEMLKEAKKERNFASIIQLFPQTGLDAEVINELKAFDLHSEVTWIFSTYHKIPVRDGLILLDSNFQTILLSDGRVSFTDMSKALYAPRGIDIGGHFINRMFDRWETQENIINGEVFPPVDERGLFAREYLLEKERISPEDFNLDGMDTEGQLLMEADLGALFYALYYYMSVLTMKEETWKAKPQLLILLPFFHEFYSRYKSLCKKKYHNWP